MGLPSVWEGAYLQAHNEPGEGKRDPYLHFPEICIGFFRLCHAPRLQQTVVANVAIWQHDTGQSQTMLHHLPSMQQFVQEL